MFRTTQILIALALLALTGCSARDACISDGAIPGTAAYINCVAMFQTHGGYY